MSRRFAAYGYEFRRFEVASEAARTLALEVVALALGIPEGAVIDREGFLCIEHDRPPRDFLEKIRPATDDDKAALEVLRKIRAAKLEQ